jgi:L-rhamnonate dehydratase
MKITDVKAVYPRWRRIGRPGSWQRHFWQIVVRVESDAGVVGLGYGGGGVPSVEVINRHYRELLVGRRVDAIDDIESIWDTLYGASIPYGQKGIAVMALSGVDLALWDLLGRVEGKPVYELLGGLRKSRVRAYATGSDTVRYRDLGFTAHKLSHRWTGAESDYDDAVASVSVARDAFGPEALLMVDCYMTWDSGVALEMARRLAGFNAYWFEDVLTHDHLDELASLRPKVKPVLLAGGEHEFTHHGFAQVARAGALDLWQPDITWCGGITAGLRIVELAKKFGVPVAPHRGGEIWGLHLTVATDCEDLAETHPDRWAPPRDELWLDEPQAVDGYIAPLDRPGFGVKLNEAML